MVTLQTVFAPVIASLGPLIVSQPVQPTNAAPAPGVAVTTKALLTAPLAEQVPAVTLGFHVQLIPFEPPDGCGASITPAPVPLALTARLLPPLFELKRAVTFILL